MIGIIVLRTCGMKLQIAFLVIGFLEENVCADTCILKLTVVFNCSGSNIYVYTSDVTVFVVYTVQDLPTARRRYCLPVISPKRWRR